MLYTSLPQQYYTQVCKFISSYRFGLRKKKKVRNIFKPCLVTVRILFKTIHPEASLFPNSNCDFQLT